MSKKTKITFGVFISLAFIFSLEVFYLKVAQTMSEKVKEDKHSFTTLSGLPDLAISQESTVRHRSLGDVFSLYSVDGALREYEKLSYAISNTKIKEHK